MVCMGTPQTSAFQCIKNIWHLLTIVDSVFSHQNSDGEQQRTLFESQTLLSRYFFKIGLLFKIQVVKLLLKDEKKSHKVLQSLFW